MNDERKDTSVAEGSDASEVYRQRYETYRHLDKLRWQMLQIAVAAGSVVMAFGRDGSAKPGWWTWAAIGVLFIVLGAAMLRICGGIRDNARVLKSAGEAIGDRGIPAPSSRWTSVSFLIAFGLVIVGIGAILASIFTK